MSDKSSELRPKTSAVPVSRRRFLRQLTTGAITLVAVAGAVGNILIVAGLYFLVSALTSVVYEAVSSFGGTEDVTVVILGISFASVALGVLISLGLLRLSGLGRGVAVTCLGFSLALIPSWFGVAVLTSTINGVLLDPSADIPAAVGLGVIIVVAMIAIGAAGWLLAAQLVSASPKGPEPTTPPVDTPS